MSLRLAVVISDLHCGSTVGLLPSDFATLEGNPIHLNPVQEWLLGCWSDLHDNWLPSVVRGEPYLLILNGDLIEGNHHRTYQIISPDTRDHVEAAISILKPVAAKAAATAVVAGTECHTGTREHTIARALGAVPDGDRPAWDRLDVTLAGVRMIFRHHVTTSIRPWLAGTALSSTLAAEQLRAARAGEVVPRVIGCGHRHEPDSHQGPDGICFVTGAWQVLTRHGHKVVSDARSKPTCVVLDWRDREDGSLPLIHERVYRAPQPKGIYL
jgi:hypothetical protein